MTYSVEFKLVKFSLTASHAEIRFLTRVPGPYAKIAPQSMVVRKQSFS